MRAGLLCFIAALVLLLLAAAGYTWRGLQPCMQPCPLMLRLIFRVTIAKCIPYEALEVRLVELVVGLEVRKSVYIRSQGQA